MDHTLKEKQPTKVEMGMPSMDCCGRTSGFRSHEVGWGDWSVSAGGLAARRRRDQDQFPSSKS